MPRPTRPPSLLFLLGALGFAGMAPLAAQPDLGTDAERARGEQVYAKWCAQCHGDDGAGRGIAAPYLQPAPRDFTSGKYQVRSTPTGALPTDADLRRVIRDGVPGTGMPGLPGLSEADVTGLVAYLKTFSDSFEDPEAYSDPVSVPEDPGFSEENVEAARALYQEIGCARCHGDSGRGDGRSAPTMRDDWGQYVRPADLTRPWTFDGGATRSDVFRSISTGLNGTPMAGFAEALSEEQRWRLVDFVTHVSGGSTSPDYETLVTADRFDGDLDLEIGEELFADAPAALFPVFGQIVQPGREFTPGIVAVEVRAVTSADEIAFLVSWHDVLADTAGTNGPDLEVPPEDVLEAPHSIAAITGDAGAEEAPGEDPFAGEVEEDPFAGDEVEEDPFADEVVDEEDPFAAEEEDFWGDAASVEETGAEASEFSDAIAIQFPRTLPEGIRKPYFIFGDAANPVELWYLDLARADRPQVWLGRGSDDLAVADDEPPAVASGYDDGRWWVIFKQEHQRGRGVTFPADTFVPVVLSVWDGFNRERGSKRGLTAWFDVYVPPTEEPSPWLPMAKAATVILVAELVLVGLIRIRSKKKTTTDDRESHSSR